ncbi:hypothetical protein ACFVFS_17215 [Kitasatospora sp. NPDC057692]|uniref:hypothetical protein n=1 Tax=Kitasatospora sp. NPDC057692 TaxID=3346215 RepID=UPI00367B9C64
MKPHFTAWLVNDRSALESDNCDVTVLPDRPLIYIEDADGEEVEVINWESTGTGVFHAVTNVDARHGDDEDAIRETEQLLEEAGWRITGKWEPLDTAYVTEVERWDSDEMWTLQQAADHMGATSAKVAAQALRRLGVEAVGRAPGRGGQSIYNAAEVMYVHATRPGQGARTDLKGGVE